MRSLKLTRVGCMLIAFSLLTIFAGCSKDDENNGNNNNGGGGQTENSLEKYYFTVEGATYYSGNLPQTDGGQSIEGINMNQNVLPGGSSMVSISSEQVYSAFCISVKGVNGYYKYIPETKSIDEIIMYNFMIIVSQHLTGGFEIELSALLPDGTPTAVYSTEINYIHAGTGSLQVSLSFDQLKDVDLYVVQPDGEIIYYGNEGVWDLVDDQYVQICGLDVDSNADCYIDSINNENIFYPAEYVQPGKYEVWVNMYSNCSPKENPTNWVITAIYEGAVLTPSYGINPTAGTYPIDEPSNTIGSSLDGATKVMEFTVINEAKAAPVKGQPIPLSESAKEKLEMAK